MICNMINQYIEFTETCFQKYLKMILKNKYDKELSTKFIETYIDARYYNYGVNDNQKIFYRKIYSALRIKADELIKEFPEKEKLIFDILLIFQYMFYFDDVRKNMGIKEVVNLIYQKRITRFEIRGSEVDDFKEEFYDTVKSDFSRKKEFLEKFESNDFGLEIKKIESNNNLNKVKLNYYFEFQDIYSKEYINKIFNEGKVLEDKAFVEYSLLSLIILQDVLEGKFSKEYFVEFPCSLFEKQKKIEQLLHIIENQTAQEKLNLELKYSDFLKNREIVTQLITRGFRIALNIDKKINEEDLNILEIFSYLILSKEDKNNYNSKNIIKI